MRSTVNTQDRTMGWELRREGKFKISQTKQKEGVGKKALLTRNERIIAGPLRSGGGGSGSSVLSREKKHGEEKLRKKKEVLRRRKNKDLKKINRS